MLTIAARVHDYGRDEPEELFSRIAADGFQGVMLAFQKAIAGVSSYYDVTPRNIEQVGQALKDHSLALEMLGVYMELGLAEEAGRQAAVDHFMEGMRVAEAMGVRRVASETTAVEDQPPGTDPQDAYRCLIRSLEQLLPTAQSRGITICLEPVYHHTLNSVGLARKLLDDLRSPHLKIVLDPANLLVEPWFQCQYQLWDEAFDQLGDEIQLVHIKGVRMVDGRRERAAQLSDSALDYPYLFQKIRALGRPLHIVREEVDPATAAGDVEYMKSLC